MEDAVEQFLGRTAALNAQIESIRGDLEGLKHFESGRTHYAEAGLLAPGFCRR